MVNLMSVATSCTAECFGLAANCQYYCGFEEVQCDENRAGGIAASARVWKPAMNV